MDCHIETLGHKATRQVVASIRRQIDIKNRLTLLAIKMAMFPHVRAKPGGASFDCHLPGQPALNQRLQAIIHRRHRNIRHFPLGSDKNFLGGRVVALGQEHGIYALALGRKTKTARGQPFAEMIVSLGFREIAHLCWAR